jgi:hypothetical protein
MKFVPGARALFAILLHALDDGRVMSMTQRERESSGGGRGTGT